jgi:hypothetical protein
MKKQLLIAAVAATMGTAAIADISISGNAKYEYINQEVGSAESTNKGNTEVNLKVTGKTGDTTIVVSQEFSQSSGSTADTGGEVATNLDIEDMYIATKIGDVNLKFGNWAGGLTANTGNILNNSRSGNKVSADVTVQGVKVGIWAVPSNGSADGFTISGNVAGVNIGIKESSKAYTSVRLSGDYKGFDLLHENLDSDTAGSDATFSSVGYTYNGVALNASMLRGDTAAALTEDDGFAALYDADLDVDTDTSASNITKITQISASTNAYGNTVTLYGVEALENAGVKNEGVKVKLTRALAGGMTLESTYASFDTEGATTDTDTFTAKLSVNF